MKTRVIAGLCMAPLLAILYFGGWFLFTAWILIALIGLSEFFNGWKNIDVKPSNIVGVAMTALLVVVGFIIVFVCRQDDAGLYEMYKVLPIVLLWLVVTIAASMIYGWKIDKRGPYDAIATLTGLVYVVFFSFHLVLLDQLQTGHLFIWTVVLSAFGSDIFAYFTGMMFGKIKLAPNLSPKKTVEGSAGGILGAGILCLIFGLIFARDYLLACFIVGIVGGAVSQAGDLTASAFKRKMGIKDYGKLIPGHGGIMDRFDSVIFVAPFVYYVVLFIVEPTVQYIP